MRASSRWLVQPQLILTLTLVSGACAQPSARADARTARDITLPVDGQLGQLFDGKVPQNATLETLFASHNVSASVTTAILKAVTSVFNPRGLRANQTYQMTRALDGSFREFRYQIDLDRELRVSAAAAGEIAADVVTMPKDIEVQALDLEIGKGQSLVGVLEAHGETIQLALALADIYGGEVDFNSDLQPGDRIEVLFERATRQGQFVSYGQVKAAILANDGRRIHAVLFPGADGHPAYFDQDGRSLKRQFLKSPLPLDPRITSAFSMHRVHPVYGGVRAHLGVDLGAPTGTAVKAVANGVVESMSTTGDAGRMVRLRHTGGYETAYLHLSAFAPGLHVGLRVAQNDVIGKVGSSGAATGPHLDYRIIKNGTYVDPMAELKKMPKGEALARELLPAFGRVRDNVLGQMSSLNAASLIQSSAVQTRPQPPALQTKK